MGSAKVTVTYTLPDSIKSSNYNLLVQKQAGNEDRQDVIINIDGQKLYDGIFDKDKQYEKSF